VAQRKSNRSDGGGIVILLIVGFLVFLPFLLISIFHYYALRIRHGITDNSQRIFQTSSIWKPIGSGVFIGSALTIAIYLIYSIYAHGNAGDGQLVQFIFNPIVFILLIISLLLFWIAYHVACWIAATYYGVLIDQGSGKIVLPKDMANYSITDYLMLKFIYELGKMESVNLRDIKRITRQRGYSLFIHGPFGSRALKFPSKQKRDECMSAIEDALGSRKTMIEFE
jgi:hypothetical protein